MNAEARQRTRSWAGAGLILLLLAVAVTIFLLEGIVAGFRSSYTVVAVLAQAPRLAAGSAVWVSGREVGEVRSVGLLPPGGDTLSRVAVVLELPRSVQQHVRRDSEVRVTAKNLVGDPVIDILPGTPAAPPLQDGDTLRQLVRPTAAAVMARARSFQLALDTALVELRSFQAPLETRLASFQRVQAQLARAQAEYGSLMRDVRASPTLALLRGDGMGTALHDSRATLQQLVAALQQVQQRAAASGATTNARALMASAARLQQTLASLEATMQQQGGTVDRLMRDSALVRAIAAARAELDSVIADAKRNPLRYVF